MIDPKNSSLADQPEGCRSLFKRPYDIKEWNKAELIEEINHLLTALELTREEKRRWFKKFKYYKVRYKNLLKKRKPK